MEPNVSYKRFQVNAEMNAEMAALTAIRNRIKDDLYELKTCLRRLAKVAEQEQVLLANELANTDTRRKEMIDDGLEPNALGFPPVVADHYPYRGTY